MTNTDTTERINPVYIGILCLSVTLIILARLTNTSADPDLWGYISFGRDFWESGFSWRDTNSYLPTKEMWIYHEWLAGVSYYQLLDDWGYSALQLYKYFVGFVTAGFILAVSKRTGANLISSLIGLLIISPMFSLSYSPIRAQVFTHLFLVTLWFVLLLEDELSFLLRLAVTLVVSLFWVNLHGGYIAGLILLSIWVGIGIFNEKNPKRDILFVIVFLAASFLNPYGLTYWNGIFAELEVARPDIPEWWSLFQAFNHPEYRTGAIHLSVVLVLGLVAILCGGKKNLRKAAMLLATGIMAILHIRHESLFLLAFGSFVPGLIWERSTAIREYLGNSAIIKNAFLIALVFVSLQTTLQNLKKSGLELSLDEYPVGAVTYLKQNHIDGNILTELDWGSYIVWELGEKSKIAIDGRYTTVFDSSVINQYLDFLYGRGDVEEFWTKYNHTIVILRPNSVAGAFVSKDSNWQKVFVDEKAEVFIKKDLIRKTPSR